jgi:tRNA nucleotidyltransferase/poly(A) polymerase
MPDYIYLLENRLSADQQNALRQMREAAREASTILFLTGDAVRDLTSGHAVRDLEVTVHGDALKLKKTIETLGGSVWGEDEASRSLYLCFPGTVRVDVVSAHRVEYPPKPGKPISHPASIQEDLRRRDFTVNAMAISLNEGSYGLLMDPMNGAADIESRTLRLVSNYGFLEEPSLLIRATRYQARLGWELDQKTRTRYDNAKEEGVIEHLSGHARSKELEQIGHEEEGLKVLEALEAEGWMKVLFPAWTAARADEEKLKALHSLATELLLQGVHADMSAAQMQLLTAKLAAKDLGALKKLMLRPGFVEEWNSLDALAAGFAKVLLAKENATPSTSFKLFMSYDPEAVLWLGFTSRDAAVKERFNLFLKVWPEARQRIPHALMQEMRITPELAAYREIVDGVFLELIDGRLAEVEEVRAFLEPHSPPAPPPQVTIKRPRAKRGAEKIKEHSFDDDEESEDSLDEDEDLDDIGGDDDDLDLGGNLPKVDLDADISDDADIAADAEIAAEDGEEDEGEQHASPAVKKPHTHPKEHVPAKSAPVQAQKLIASPPAARLEKPAKSQPAPKVEPKPAPPAKPGAPAKPAPPAAKPAFKAHPSPAPAKLAPVPAKKPTAAAKHTPQKPVAKAPVKPAAKAAAKAPVKSPVKVQAKAPVKPAAAKTAPVKKASAPAASAKWVKPVAKPVAKKPAPKPAKKR